MLEAAKAMTTWLGTLARSGVVTGGHEQAGVAVATFVVGEPRLELLREWWAGQPSEVAEREKKAAVEVCIWMAHADRRLAPEEATLLRDLVAASHLPAPAAAELTRATEFPPPLEGIEERLTHPVLRELLLALAWELAMADGRVDIEERSFYDDLARRLGVRAARADAIRRAVDDQVQP